MATVTLDGLTKIYDDAKGTERAVDDVSLTVPDGELVALVGPSGCGKSTTLRLVAGLESVTEGTISFDGREVQHLAPAQRNVAMVFQNYALYAKMTGAENMAFGLKHSTDLPADERDRRVREAAELLGIGELLEKRPADLSGGEKQRVALGRAIVRDPAVFLMDEPLSNLDAKRRAQMRTEVQRIHGELDVATIYVTHDQKEAMTMGDRIAVMHDGRIEQVAAPETAYDDPVNRFVATFLGSPAMNLLPGRLERVAGDEGRRAEQHPGAAAEDLAVVTDAADRVATLPAGTIDPSAAGTAVDVGLRPEDLLLSADPGARSMTATLAVTEYQGKEQFVHLDVGEETLVGRTRTLPDLAVGDRLGVGIDPRDVYVFERDSGASLKTRTTPLGARPDAAEDRSVGTGGGGTESAATGDAGGE